LTTCEFFARCPDISLTGESYEVSFQLQLNHLTELSLDLPDSCGGLAVALSCFGADGPGRANQSRSVGAAEPATFADFRPWRREHAGPDGASAGTYPITITGTQGNLQRSSTVQLTVGGAETPFGGTPWPLPGLIQAENFDNGGNGVGYFNLFTSNPAGTNYRPGTTVGVEDNFDLGGGYDVGYTDEGQWLNYTVNVRESGLYNLQARVASLGPGGYWHAEFDGRNVTGNQFTPVTYGWQTWTTMVSPEFWLNRGQRVMRVVFDGNGPTGGMVTSTGLTCSHSPRPRRFPPVPLQSPV
jgi:carbohydrate binding protein with CBM6 domain